MYKSTRGHTLKSIKACYLGHIDQRQPENEAKAKGKYRLPRQTVGWSVDRLLGKLEAVN